MIRCNGERPRDSLQRNPIHHLWREQVCAISRRTMVAPQTRQPMSRCRRVAGPCSRYRTESAQ